MCSAINMAGTLVSSWRLILHIVYVFSSSYFRKLVYICRINFIECLISSVRVESSTR